jgi:hypothetical protein
VKGCEWAELVEASTTTTTTTTTTTNNNNNNNNNNSVASVRLRTIPTERPPLVGEVSANS